MTPVEWTAPPWVLQEFGYAVRAGKKAILFIENGVSAPGIDGDIEYVPYDSNSPSDALTKATEMIVNIVAQKSGIAVETIVVESPSASSGSDAAPVPANVETLESEGGGNDADNGETPDFQRQFKAFHNAVFEKDFEQARRLIETGAELVKNGAIANSTDTFWRSYTLHQLAKAGDSTAIQLLEDLARSVPNDPDPQAFLGAALSSYTEYRRAIVAYKKAADLEPDVSKKLSYIGKACDFLVQTGQHKQAESELVLAYAHYCQRVTESFGKQLFALLSKNGRKLDALGAAEEILSRNPAFSSLRFDVGLGYHRADMHEMFLHHFALLTDHDNKDSASTHNLALAYSENEMQIRSVATYKTALQLGSTKAAANLGFKYVDAGMADEAREMLSATMKQSDCDPEVSNCLYQLTEREQGERKKYEEAQKRALKTRDFMSTYGAALAMQTVDIAGHWTFPFAELDLQLEGSRITGSGRVEKEETSCGLNNLAGLLGGIYSASPQTPTKHKSVITYMLSGDLRGAAAEVELKTTYGPTSTLLGSPETKTFLVVFELDGSSGLCSSVEKSKIGNPQQIRRNSTGYNQSRLAVATIS